MTEANYVLHRFPMTISYKGNDVNQFTVEGFAKISIKGNTEEIMTVKNLNFLDFVIRFLLFLTKEDTIFNKKESNIAFDTKDNTFNKRTRLLGFSDKTKDIKGNPNYKMVTLNYNDNPISFNIEIDIENKNKIKNIENIYTQIQQLFTDDDLDKIDRNTITNNATNLYKQDTVFHLLRLRMWAENKFNESVSFFTKTECGNNNTLMNNHLPIMLLTDSYKLGHPNMYPNEAIKMVAYGEFRGPMKIDGETVGDDRIVVCGLEYIIKNYINRTWCKKDLDDAVKFFNHHAPGDSDGMGSLYDFPKAEFEAIIKKDGNYKGKIPLTVEGLPDGTVVLPHTPVYKITAEQGEDKGVNFSKLITFFETILTMVWYPSCVATLSRHCKQIIENAYIATGLADKKYNDDGILQFSQNAGTYKESILKIIDESLRIDGTIQFSMHDFGFRGATSVEQSVLGGMAHLLNFAGTDTMTAAYMAQQENQHEKPVGFSIPATEHSVMTSFPYEKDAIKNMFVKYIKQDSSLSIFAIVMDSYDYTRALFKELPNAIMEYNNVENKSATFTQGGLKLNHNNDGSDKKEQNVKEYENYKVVLRPDSGDSIEVVLLGLVAACAIFGWTEYTVNDKTYIQCKNSGVIQGDGINVHKLEEILQTLTGTKKDEKGQMTYNKDGVNIPLTQYKITSETDSQLESWFKEKPAAAAVAAAGGAASAAAPAPTSPATAPAPTSPTAAPETNNNITKITTYKNGKPIYKYEMTLEKYMEKIILTNKGTDNGDGNSKVRITHALKYQVNTVLGKLKTTYFTPDCMAFGMGGGLIQKVNRDTMKFATKLCSSTQKEGENEPKNVIVMKNPATDPGKRSIPGNMDVINKETNEIPFQVVSLEDLENQKIEGDGVEITKGDDEKGESKMTVKYENLDFKETIKNFGEKRDSVNKGWNGLRTYIEGKKEKKEHYPEDRKDYYDETAKPHFSTKLNDMQQFYDPSQKKFVIKKKDPKKDEGNRNATAAENRNGADPENGTAVSVSTLTKKPENGATAEAADEEERTRTEGVAPAAAEEEFIIPLKINIKLDGESIQKNQNYKLIKEEGDNYSIIKHDILIDEKRLHSVVKFTKLSKYIGQRENEYTSGKIKFLKIDKVVQYKRDISNQNIYNFSSDQNINYFHPEFEVSLQRPKNREQIEPIVYNDTQTLGQLLGQLPASTPQAGGSSSQSSSSLLNELNYELHLSMYVQKLLKMLIYRYLNHAGIELTYKEYMMEMFVNMVVFSVLNISNGDHFVCYLVDQMMIFIAMQIYLRIAQKENWTIDNNHLSAIILAPYYVVLC